MENRDKFQTPAALSPPRNTGNNLTGGWVGPKAGTDMCGRETNFLHVPKFEPRTVQFVAQ